jgi:IclR family transcriptional regulator, pca regulon regulatory protein
MAGRGQGPDFVEALARGLDVIACFGRERPEMSLSDVAQATGLARPTARRLLLTLEELGFVRSRDGQFALTPRVLSLGTAYVAHG